MTYLRTLFFLLAAGLVVVIAFGPRPVVDETLRATNLPADLDAYLAGTESRYADLLPGAKKTIFWANPEKTRTPVAIVYLHGFSATRQETRPLSDSLAARLGANLFYTRLAGHGRSDDAMGEASVNDWFNDTMEAYQIGRRLGEKVVVIGTSTGGTLATWLASRPEAADLLALVLISPNYGPKDPLSALLTWPFGEQLARLVVGPYYTWEPANDDHARYWKTRHPSRALIPMMGLVDHVNALDFEQISQPVLVLYSPQDQVVNPEHIAEAFPRFGASTKVLIPIENPGDPSHHVLAGDILSPGQTLPTVDHIQEFLTPLLAAPTR